MEIKASSFSKNYKLILRNLHIHVYYKNTKYDEYLMSII